MLLGEFRGEALGLRVEDEVDVALAVERDVFLSGDVPSGVKPITLNRWSSASGSGWQNSTNSNPSVPMGLSSEISGGRGIVGERTHWFLLVS